VPLIDLDPVQMYQAPAEADLASERLSMMSISNVSVICGERNASGLPGRIGGWGRRLDHYNLIEYLNFTGWSSSHPFDLSPKPAPDLKGTKLYARGNIHYPRFL
jgi:hypothetical protein